MIGIYRKFRCSTFKKITQHLGCGRSSSRQWRQRRGWPGKTCNAH